MSQLLEDPTLILAAGGLMLGLLGVVFYQTGRAVVLAAMGGVALLTLGGVALERLVVTDREQVEHTLYAVADALEANDLNAILAYLAPEAGPIQARAQQALADFKVEAAEIRGLQVSVSSGGSVPKAEADFVGTLVLEDRRGQAPYDHFVRRFRVFFERRSQGWVMTGYEDRELIPAK